MATHSFSFRLQRTIDDLPESRQADVLAFVRFLRLGLAADATIERRFMESLDRARSVAAERGVTEGDVDLEVKAARTER